jgi:hypothetical protein
MKFVYDGILTLKPLRVFENIGNNFYPPVKLRIRGMKKSCLLGGHKFSYSVTSMNFKKTCMLFASFVQKSKEIYKNLHAACIYLCTKI